MTSRRDSKTAPKREYSNVPFATRKERVKSNTVRQQSAGAIKAYREKVVKSNPSRTWKTEKPTLLKDVIGTKLIDVENFAFPVFKKVPAEVALIKEAIKQNFFFADLNPKDLITLIVAFEPMQVNKDDRIIEQGETGDYFYVIGGGQVTFLVNGVNVGSGDTGKSFGELALMYSCPRAATVVAASEPTKLFRVDQTTFRAILQKQTEEVEEEKTKLLKSITYLDEVLMCDIRRLGRVMTPRVFEEGDCLTKKGAPCDTFFVLQEGEAKATNGDDPSSSSTLKAGECFGGGALVSVEPNNVDVIAATKGMAWTIDHATFHKIFGSLSGLVMRSKDRRTLEGIDIFVEGKICGATLDELVAQITEEKYEANTPIFEFRKYTEAALYFVHKGAVQLSGNRNELIKVGEYFGAEQLLLDARRSRTPSPTSPSAILTEYNAIATEDCVCGMLTLSDCRTVFDTTTLVDVEAIRNLLEAQASPSDEDDVPPPTTSMARMTTQEWLIETSNESLRESAREDVALEDLHRHVCLGEGQYGDVWLVSADVGYLGKQHFALKIQLRDDPERGYSVDAIMQEISVLRQMDHPQIVNMVHHYEDEKHVYILMGLVHGGELFDVIHQQGDDGLWYSGMPEEHAKFYTVVLADTLNYIHRKQFAFRDLKPENVLIDKDGYPIVCDFGFAKHLPDNCKTYTLCGTPNYLAPEVITNRGHNFSADHWSLGILIYEMIAGENPFYHDDMDQITLFKTIVEDKYYALPDDVSDEAYLVIDHLLEKDPRQRLGSLAGGGKDILRSKWCRTLDLVRLRQKREKAPFVPNNLELEGFIEETSRPSLLDDSETTDN